MIKDYRHKIQSQTHWILTSLYSAEISKFLALFYYNPDNIIK